MKRKPATIDDYLATVKGERRAALDQLRKTIRSIVPRAEECISYNMPAFRLDSRKTELLPREIDVQSRRSLRQQSDAKAGALE
jgi:uncharacterized protein YdhG (YjbR/CyaY superfamily)